MTPRVSVIISSYSRPHTLGRAIASCLSQDGVETDVIVVDNLSPRSDEICALVRREFPSVRLVDPRANLGFGRAINLGAREARGDWLYLGVDDVVLDPGCLAALVAHHTARPNAGISTPVLYQDKPGRPVQAAGGALPFGRSGYLPLIAKTLPTADWPVVPVEFAPGGIILIGRAVFEALGGFREEFFLYEEDTELCLRVTRSGRDICVVLPAGATDLWPPHEFDKRRITARQLANQLTTAALHAPKRSALSLLARRLARDAMAQARPGSEEARTGRETWRLFAQGLPGIVAGRLGRR